MKNIFSKGLAFLFILIFVNFNLQAQDQSIRFLDVGEFSDYSDYRTWDLFQDSRGFIWIGTLSGMDRWDGSRLRSYTMPPFDSLGFPASAVQSLVEDDHNNLWLGTRLKGIVKYDLENEQFTSINNAQGKNPNSNITCLKYDKSGFLWVGALSGLYRYFPEDNRYEFIQFQDSVMEMYNDNLEVMDIEFDTLGVMWVSGDLGLYYYDEENNVCKPPIIDLSIIPPDYIPLWYGMSIDSDGIIWILMGKNEVVRFNPYSKAIDFLWPRKFEYRNYNVGWGAIKIDSEGKVWLSSNRNIVRYDPSNGMIIQEGDDPITEIIEDRDGNIIASSFGGVKILDKSGSQIEKYTDDYLGIDTWNTEILIDNNIYWIGTWGDGVLKLNEETGEKVYYTQSDKAGSLDNNFITKILRDQNNQIWIKTLGSLHLYDQKNDNFKRFTFEYGSVITEGRDKNIWIVDRYNLIRLDPVTFDTLKIPLKQPLRGIASFDVYGFVQDTIGFFWISGLNSDGLIRINPETGELISYRHNIKNPDGLAGYPVKILFFDSKDRMWAGTKTGLSLVHTFPNSDSIYCVNYFEKDGLIGDDIYGLVEDPSGNIWIGTAQGISVLKTDGTIHNLSEEDGIEKPLIWTISSDTEGNIYAGTADIFKIPSNFLQANKKVPSVFLTDIQVSGESIYPEDKSPLKKSVLFADQIKLKYYENFVRIEFAALNYTHPEKNRYRYILKGVDRDTVNALHKNYAEYTDLRPGKYTFWATGSNNSGLWNREGKQLMVIIHPPPWASWWAYTIYGLIVIYFIFLYRQFIIRRAGERLSLKFQEEEVKRMKDLDTMKSTFFANISHEFRTPLALILGPLESLAKGNFTGNLQKEAKIMYNNGKRLIRSINQILNLSKIDADKLELKASKLNFGDFVNQVVANYDTAAAEKNITLHSDIEENIELYFDPDLMQDVINNLISNALKFTPDHGTIQITASIRNNNFDPDIIPGKNILEFTVKDTGIGIPEDQISHIFDRFYQVDSHHTREYEGTGIGLALTREIVILHHGIIDVKSEPGYGTQFTVLVPSGSEHLKPEQIVEGPLYHIKEEQLVTDILSDDRQSDEELDNVPGLKSKSFPLILIVEDNPDMRRYMHNQLVESYRVIESKNGVDGLERAKEEIPELILSDIMMPKMDGIEFCNEIRKDEKTRHIPVILLTAKAGKESRIEGLETGADDYITKPFDADELRIRIQNLIEQRKNLREKFSKKWIMEPEKIDIKSADDKFLSKVMQLVEDNINNSEFTVKLFSYELGMSKPQLYRKLVALTDMSPNVFLRTIRLKKAAQLFKAKAGSIADIAYQVGFSSPSYFTQCFKETFGSVPTEYS